MRSPAQYENDNATSANAPAPKSSTADEPQTRSGPEDDEQQSQDKQEEEDNRQSTSQAKADEEDTSAPPLPDEVPPPLPTEIPPGKPKDDGWEPVWDANAQAYYFYNRFTQQSQWENPRVPDTKAPGTVDSASAKPDQELPKKPVVTGGYNPAIHGDYDPTASYAQDYEDQDAQTHPAIDPAAVYEAIGTFNRFTGRWQAAEINPDNHNDENKSGRQMNAFFDVDAAANSHDGRSLRAERSQKKLSKKELKAFKDKRREKKEEKRRAWLRD